MFINIFQCGEANNSETSQYWVYNREFKGYNGNYYGNYCLDSKRAVNSELYCLDSKTAVSIILTTVLHVRTVLTARDL